MTDQTETIPAVQERAALALNAPEHERTLRELATKSTAIVAITNAAGLQECHEARMTLKRARIEIEKLGKTAREDAQAFASAVIAEERRLVDLIKPEETRLQTIQDEYEAKLQAEKEARERAEQARVENLKARVNELRMIPLEVAGKTSKEIADVLATLLKRLIGDVEFQEFTAEAVSVRQASLDTLRLMIQREQNAEAEAARLAEERTRLDAERARQEHERKVRTAINDIALVPAKLTGMPSTAIGEAIRTLDEDREAVADELSERRRWLGELLGDWRDAVVRAREQLSTMLNHALAQERDAAEAKARAEREAKLASVRAEIQAWQALPGKLIGASTSTVEVELEAFADADLRAEAARIPPELFEEWRDARAVAQTKISGLLAQGRETDRLAAEAADRKRADDDREEQARLHAAMEAEQKKATADAIAALQAIAELAADLKGEPDHARARNRIAGMATGTLAAIAKAAPKPKRERKPAEARQAELRG